MQILKSILAAAVAGGAALAVSATAFAATTTTPAGPLTIRLTCDTGPGGSGTFTVTANSKSSTVSVKCGGSATVTNAAWTAGSLATIHQSAATASGQLRALNVRVTLQATAQTVFIRNFRSASTAATTGTLAQTGGGFPILPLGGALLGVLLIAVGSRVATRQG